ncbi:MAG TPA: copper chaperone PCu(A)C, partial [Alphaproteobacteria bacterium]|nr:copper chaperone PCu(A)C [Alphaproteobacteria bacterium]
TSAETPIAQSAMFHRTTMKNGVMSMDHLEQVPLPPGKTVSFAPNKMHIMLMNLRKPLKDGDHIPLTLYFAEAGAVDVEVYVQKGMPKSDELEHHNHH